jgi:hypothetical protein
MTRPLTVDESRTFGADASIHPITNLPLERGHGALPPREQAFRQHLWFIERRDGKAAADEMRKKLEAAEQEVAQQLAAEAVRLEKAAGLDEGDTAAASLGVR